MGDWKDFSLIEMAEILNYKRAALSAVERKYKKGIFPYYGASGIIDYIDEYLFEGPHVLISEDGDNLKTRNTPVAFIADGRFWVGNHAHIVKGKKDYINRLITYYFKNLDLNPYLTGAVQPKLSKANLISIPIHLPSDEEEQRAITSVLSGFDEHIELLYRQNTTIEQMAATLFRHWFIQEAAVDWEETTLRNHTRAYKGLSYVGIGLTDKGQGIPMHNLKSIKEFGDYRFEGIKFYNGKYSNRYLVSPGDILIANTEQGHKYRLIGYPAVVPDTFGPTGIFSQHLFKIVPTGNSYLTNEFLYYLLITPRVREQIISAINGSTVNILSIDGLQRPSFRLPPKEKVVVFSKLVKAWWEKKNFNCRQIMVLSQLRDLLLPGLLTGEVRVEKD